MSKAVQRHPIKFKRNGGLIGGVYLEITPKGRKLWRLKYRFLQKQKKVSIGVYPIIGKYPIKIITHKMLLDLAHNVKQRGAHELAKRIIQMSIHIFRYAIVTGRADRNITEDLKGEIKSQPKGHFAAIEAKDLPEFISDLRNHKNA